MCGGASVFLGAITGARCRLYLCRRRRGTDENLIKRVFVAFWLLYVVGQGASAQSVPDADVVVVLSADERDETVRRLAEALARFTSSRWLVNATPKRFGSH